MKTLILIGALLPSLAFAQRTCPSQIIRVCEIKRTASQTISSCGEHKDIVVKLVRYEGTQEIVLSKSILVENVCPEEANQTSTQSPACF